MSADWIDRCAGVLLHATSLPRGRLDGQAARFAGFLGAAGFRVWQMLPVGPADAHGSPYQPDSAFAGHVGLLADGDEPSAAEVAAYVEANADWLPDYALFKLLGALHEGAEWHVWPAALRLRDPAALQQARRDLADEIAAVEREQCRFDLQWRRFKRLLNDQGLLLFGDVPLFLAHNSADCWAHPELFEIGPDGHVEAFMGVPPDYFSEDGQWWGYPPYRWAAMAAQHYAWWKRRFEVWARRLDLVRVDHFRGLCAFWRIPREAASARDGAWVPGPGRSAIDVLAPVLRESRLVPEDLGDITPDVIATRRALGLPGMRVLQFAFDGDPDNLHLPHRHEPDTVCYTGTHDNDTTLGWWQAADASKRDCLRRYLNVPDSAMPQALIDCAWATPAPLAIAPMQDLLALGSAARMNRPGVLLGNWTWRLHDDQFDDALAARLRERLAVHGRLRD